MNILLTNDDGYFCEGLKALARGLSREHNVYIVAPDSEMSCSSHSAHFTTPVSFEFIGEENGAPVWSLHGTPSDCVLYGIRQIFREIKFDVVISGINTVLNVGSDAIYSGTFGAAQEGTFQGYPSIAVSLDEKLTGDYDYAVEFTVKNLSELIKYATDNITLNVNIPSPYVKDIKGVKSARMACRPYNEKIVEELSKDGKSKTYKVHGKPIPQTDENSDTDAFCIEHGYIAVTPVQLVSVDREHLSKMQEAGFSV